MRSIKNFYFMLRRLKMDWSRYTGNLWNPFVLLFNMLIHPGMQFSLWYRFERYLLYESNILFKIFGMIFYPLYFFVTYYVLSYHIEPQTEIAGGLMLHNREIVMTEHVTIGKYFTCMGQVTIARNFHEKADIHIGENVMVGTGAKIVATGKLEIADGVVIGANAVVTKNAPEKNGVYAGIPAKFIKIKKI